MAGRRDRPGDREKRFPKVILVALICAIGMGMASIMSSGSVAETSTSAHLPTTPESPADHVQEAFAAAAVPAVVSAPEPVRVLTPQAPAVPVAQPAPVAVAPVPVSPPAPRAAPTPVKPLWDLKHKSNGDAVFGLMFGYSKIDYQRFVGSLRASGYQDDIVLATSTESNMKPGVADYLKKQRVLSYPFGFVCKKRSGRRLLVTPAGCTLTDWYEGGDTRGPRPLALIRYEHYRTWLDMYTPQSWILIMDTRDSFFQLNPFSADHGAGRGLNRNENIDVHLFEENRVVKRVGICPFNSGWLGCWGRDVPKRFANNSVVCSGSTLGHHAAVVTYAETMIGEFDSQQCHVSRGTESDQGYHNYLFHTGKFAEKGLRIRANPQVRGAWCGCACCCVKSLLARLHPNLHMSSSSSSSPPPLPSFVMFLLSVHHPTALSLSLRTTGPGCGEHHRRHERVPGACSHEGPIGHVLEDPRCGGIHSRLPRRPAIAGRPPMGPVRQGASSMG